MFDCGGHVVFPTGEGQQGTPSDGISSHHGLQPGEQKSSKLPQNFASDAHALLGTFKKVD